MKIQPPNKDIPTSRAALAKSLKSHPIDGIRYFLLHTLNRCTADILATLKSKL